MKTAGMVLGAVLVGALVCGAVVAQDAGEGPRIEVAPQLGTPQISQARVLATVTGHVTCSDTQRAARFATVTLIGADSGENNGGGFGFGRRFTARTDIDGNYTLEAEPGDYYVTATAMGYASPVAEAAVRLRSGASAADLLSSLPEVHVAEGSGGTANITLDRGGVISGKLQWDDGTPAAGVNVSAQSVSQATATTTPSNVLNRIVAQLGGGFGGLGFQASDDRGYFRIMGLAPGSYWVRASIMTPSAEPGMGMQRTTAIVMYAPGKVRRSDAQVVTLKSGEERDDLAFMLDLTALHSVSGHVSATDSATIESGQVRLTDTQDSSLSRMAMIEPDGSFVVQWVPAGTYTLAVSNASNVPTQSFGRRGQTQTSGTTYSPFSESLTVTDTDLSGVNLTLTPGDRKPVSGPLPGKVAQSLE